MNKFRLLLVAGLLTIFICSLWLYQACAEDITAKDRTAWENEMANRVEQALEKFLGPEKTKVFLKAQLEIKQTQTQTHNYTIKPENNQSQNSAAGQDISRGISWLWPVDNQPSTQQQSFILPGISANGRTPVPQAQQIAASVTPIKGNETAQETTLLPEISVKKLSAVVMIDASVSEENFMSVNRITKTILEIDTTRGDTFQVIRVPFVPVWKKITLSPPMLLDAIKWAAAAASFALAGLFVLIGLHVLGKTISQAVVRRTTIHEIDMNLNAKAQAGLGVINAPGQITQALATHQGTSSPNLIENKGFSFANEHKAENIAKAIENEDSQTIATLLFHLDPQKTTNILGLLPKNQQSEIAIIMAKTDFLDKKKIKSAEEKLKIKLESFVEGETQMVDILSRINPDARETILTSIKDKDPELAGRLQKEIFKFEDIAALNAEEINLVLSGISHEDLSIALRGMPDTFTDSVTKAMPKEAQKALKQWIALGKPQPTARIEEIRGRVVETARKLEQEGRISRSISPHQRQAFGDII